MSKAGSARVSILERAKLEKQEAEVRAHVDQIMTPFRAKVLLEAVGEIVHGSDDLERQRLCVLFGWPQSEE